MIHRCEDLGIVNESQAKRLWINYNRRRWRREEPLDGTIPIEQPRLLRRSIELLVRDGVKTPKQILEELCLPMGDVAEICGLPTHFFSGETSVVEMPKLKRAEPSSSIENRPSGRVVQFSKD